MKVHPEFGEFIRLLNANHVEYAIVGSFALAYHGHPRATGDMDVWIRPEVSNIDKFLVSLKEFGFEELGLTKEDFGSGKVIQLGYPPVRIDIVTVLDSLESDEIRDSREAGKFGDQPAMYLGRKAFIKNKRAVGRHKDLADLEALGEKV